MALLGLGTILGAIGEAEIQASWDRIKRHEAIQQILRRLGQDFDPQAPDFDYVYTYTLVSFSLGKPKAVVEFFYQPSVRQLLRQAFEAVDEKFSEEQIRDLCDQPILQRLDDLDISSESLLKAFFDCFNEAVDRCRTVVDIRHERQFDRIETRIIKISQVLSSMEGLIAPALPRADSPETGISEDKLYHSQIEQASNLIRQDKADAALSVLNKVKAELQGTEPSATLKFQLLTNIGASYLVLGRDDEAVPYFEGALECASNNPQALSNAALAEIIKGNSKQAIEFARQALQIRSGYPLALSVLIRALVKTGKLHELDSETRSLAEQDIESRRSLALALIETEEYEQAEKLLRLSITSDNSEPQDSALLAHAILGQIQSVYWKPPCLPWKAITELTRLEEAESLLNQVVDTWKLNENRKRFHSVLGLRANARALQRKFELALQDCQRILMEDPQHQQALYNAGLFALELKNPHESISYLEKYRNVSLREQPCIPLAVAYLQVGQPRDALKILLEIKEEDEDQEVSVFLERLTLIVEAAHMAEEDNLVPITLLEKLDALPKDNPLVLEALGTICSVQERPEQAIDYLQQGLKFSQGNLNARIVFELAEVYYRQQKFDQAQELYAIVAPIDANTLPTQRYIVSLLSIIARKCTTSFRQ